jgi:hypothetical protein
MKNKIMPPLNKIKVVLTTKEDSLWLKVIVI